MRIAAPAQSAARTLGVAALGSLLALPFVLTLALGNSLSHDEHQHIAAGVLIAREGLSPYRDFAYFHVPYLAWVYGGLFRLTDHYLLASRLVSAAFAVLTCGVVFAVAWASFGASSRARRFAVSTGALIALLATPLFGEVVGHSWNQEPSVFFLLAAFVLLLASPPAGGAWRIGLAGLLLGIAAGFRVTVLPMVLPLAIMAWLAAPAGTRRWRGLALFALGLSFGLLPVAISFLAAPEGFLFGNVEFPSVNVTYRMSTGEPRTMTLFKKLRFLFKLVMRPNWLLFYGFLAVVLFARFGLRQRLGANRPFMLVLLALPFLLIGAIAPSPAFDQYFYPLAPFLVIGAVSVLAAWPADSTLTRGGWAGLALALAIACIRGWGPYGGLPRLVKPGEWATHELRAEAAEMLPEVRGGKVLTLAPTLPLEAGLRVYPEFATGPFAWRVASFVPASRRPVLKLLAPEDLEARLAGDPPAAILTGFEERWEEPFERYAVAHGFRKVPAGDNKTLWVAPLR